MTLPRTPVLASAGCEAARRRRPASPILFYCIACFGLLAGRLLARPRADGAGFATASRTWRRVIAAETTLQTYLREINRYPLLSAKEEKALAEKVQNEDKQAREDMIRANLRLVVNIARNYLGRGLTFMDLIEEGLRRTASRPDAA